MLTVLKLQALADARLCFCALPESRSRNERDPEGGEWSALDGVADPCRACVYRDGSDERALGLIGAGQCKGITVFLTYPRAPHFRSETVSLYSVV